MKRSGFVRPLLIVAVGIVLLIAISLAVTADGKIPITTKSEEALKQYLKGRDLAERLRGPDAREYLEKAVALDPDFALGHLGLALVQPTAKGFFEHFNKALALVDKVSDGERWMIMGVEAGTNADPMRQREIYQQLVASYPDDERAHNLLGTNYFGQQEWENAITEYRKATKINTDFSPSYNQMGYAQRFLANYKEAEKAFQRYIELIPDDPNPYDSYAELLMKMGKYQESIDQYRKALSIDPTFAASHIGIASNLNFMGKHAEAREQLQKLYDKAVDDGQRRQAHFSMAVSYVDEGNTDMAIKHINKQYAVAEKINDFAAMSGDMTVMGNIQYEAGRYDEALTSFQTSVALIEKANVAEEVKETTRRNNLYNEGRVALMKGDVALATKKSDEFTYKVDKIGNPFEIRLAHELKGMIALQQKDYKTAHANLAKANQQNPYNLYRLAVAYQGEGDKQSAKKMCEQATNFNALNSLNQAFATHKAKRMMAGM